MKGSSLMAKTRIAISFWQSAFWALWPDGGNRNRGNVPSGLKHTNVLICHSCVIHQPRTCGGEREMSTNVCLANANDRREKETLTHASPPRGREEREITALFPGFLPHPPDSSRGNVNLVGKRQTTTTDLSS